MPTNQFSINMNNCVFIDPQIQLGAALANGDLHEFKSALDNGAIPTTLDSKYNTVFETALQTYGRAAFVEECLRHGTSPNLNNHHYNKAAINFAADSRDPEILHTLLKHEGVNVNRKYAELTPLNFLAKNVAPENFEDTLRCIRMLLEYGASPNIPDHRDLTPLLHVLKNRKLDDHRKRELIHLFLQQKTLDIDSCREGEARIMLTKHYPELQLPAVVNSIDFESLIRDIGNYDESQFIEHFHSYQLNISEADNLSNLVQEQNTQLLLEAIKLGLHRVVDTLIEAGTNINSVHNGNTAIQIASSWGNWLALKKLLEHNHLEIRKQDHLLITVIRKLDYKESHDYVDYQKCFDLLLDSGRICINETDESGGTALHYAAHDRNANAVQKLLERGAYIGIKSSFGDLPIEAMQPDVLMQHFDNCITTNGLKCGDSNFEIIVDFKNLIPPADNEVSSRHLGTEMAPIAFFASSKEHLNLLQHPLITSFLFLKWHRLSIVFYVNFLLYSFFAISIVTHTILKFNESEHEIVTSLFGLFSWIGIAYLVLRELIQISMAPTRYFRSITNYMEIALIVLSILTCSESSYDQETQRVIAVFTMLLVSLELCLLVGSLPVLSISTHMLMLRAVSKSFLKSFTLYSIFVITFSLCFYILFGKPTVARNVATETSSNVTSYNEDNYEFKNCSLAAIKKGLCGDRNAPGDDEDNDEFNTFSNPLVAVIKTIVMLTGEFDAGDIKFDTLYSYLLFLLFVVFMSIVLFNLLNGLAVSDTQVIRQQAELNGSICRANLLTRYEEVLTGRSGRASFIVKHEPFRTICGRVLNLYPNYLSGRQIAILPNDSNKVMVPLPSSYEMKTLDAKTKTAATTVQSTNGLRNQKAAAFIRIPDNENEREKKLLDPPVQFLPCCCSCITGKCSVMDSRTVKLAMTVIEQKTYNQRQKQHLQNTERRLQNIENMLNQVFEMLRDIQSK